jgi:glycosyltransferase involved in cell wall biosynthesis
MAIYHQRQLFRSADLERIEQKEAEWLSRAQCVAFTSEWAANRCIEHYGIKACSVCSVGIFGEIEMPDGERYRGARQFVFASTDFEAKGGAFVLAAFRRVRERFPDASLVIIGAAPPSETVGQNIVYVGYLKKEDAIQRQQFREILATSRALVHPTRSDIAPLIIIEAGYFGCPTISVRRFAIPEQIEHQVTGMLIDDPSDASVLADAMTWMIENEAAYDRMRKRARIKASVDSSKEVFKQRMCALVANQ